MFCSPAPS